MIRVRPGGADETLNDLGMETMKYINYFAENITDGDPLLCDDFLKGEEGYERGRTIGEGKVGSAAVYTKGDIAIALKRVEGKLQEYISLRVIPDYERRYWRIFDGDERVLIAAGGNSFTTQTTIHYILLLLLRDDPNYLLQYDAFYCDRYGYNITEYCNQGTLHDYLERMDLSDDLLLDCLGQILSPLSILKRPRYSFNHSDLKAKNVFVNNGVLKIADFDKSSIFYNGFRFHNNTHDYSLARPQPIIPEGGIYRTGTYNRAFIMFNPYGMPMSYDVYTLMVSLFGVKKLLDGYNRGEFPYLERVMKSLFVDDYYKIMVSIGEKWRDLGSMNTINRMLVGATLLEDISFLYEEFGIAPPPLNEGESNEMRVVLSKDGHICLDECKKYKGRSGNTCNTNKYSKQRLSRTVYEWDSC